MPASLRSAYDQRSPSDCDPSLALFADASERRAVSSVHLTPTNDLAFDLSPRTGAAFARASSEGVSTQGYVAFGALDLRVARDVHLPSGHVTLRAAAHAKVTSVDDRGVHLAVRDDVLEIVGVDVVAACEDLEYDPKMKDASPSEVGASSPTRWLRTSELHLKASPGGPVVALFRSARPSELAFTVSERRGAELHVVAATDSFELDGWVDVAETGEEGTIGATLDLGSCGGIVDDMNPSCVAPTSDVLAFAARSPAGHVSGGMRVTTRARLEVIERVGEYTAVYAPFAGIAPRDDQQFWIPSSRLSPCPD